MRLRQTSTRTRCLWVGTSGGFTLVEVLVSLSILAIAFVALWGLYFACIRVDLRNSREAEGRRFAMEQLERMRTWTPPLPAGNDTCGPANAPFTRVWTITKPRPWEYGVAVTVSWTEKTRNLTGGQASLTRNIALNTIIADLR